MRIEVHDIHTGLTQEQASLARERVETALARFSTHLGAVDVRFLDINGPRGGVDKRCTITIEVVGAPDVRIEEDATTVEIGVSVAADRAKKVVASRVDKLSSR